ncbi:MAG: cysteine synthase A [Ruminococcaceae bacterium]|nr:cysteine synthase A [Oscillospiraceae bacterium]
MIYKQITELVGKTPLMELCNYEKENNLEAKIIAKLECMNPAGSSKDRIAVKMIEEAEKKGLLKEGSVIIEPTSGNTGIGLASAAAAKGYKVILTMPDTMSVERRNLLKAYGAEIVLTEGSLGMNGAVAKAEELKASHEGSFIPGQFVNPDNPKAHYETTGPEIWEDTEGQIDIFVAGIGTGGTISGTGKYLKEKNPQIKIVGIEPASSPLITEGRSGSHKLQGIGANFIPDTFDKNICDEIITIEAEDAFIAGRTLATKEGFLVGISSGAALHGAKILAQRPENKGKTIVVLLPDSGERYLSTEMFNK